MQPSTTEHTPATSFQERRKRPDLRALFEKTIPRLEPFFSNRENLNGNPTEYWAAKLVRDLHPDLSEQDAHMLVGAAARYFRERTAAVSA
ncbi:MAG: hypothetical protein FD187_1581 [bacterium]|nr:MAG: hypothetical protein FD142_1948 [bacterium]KAF0148786.1 MAG: hypothetical protein FD187_1581 [bacterium]KAF0167352.1 MAG: hypothetical protein FD158_2372 [bacterium]TXT16496.1 MAG: hypothetical protein FD132_2798 [bacterium]